MPFRKRRWRRRVSAQDGVVPDLDEIKQGEQGARDRRGRFAKGRSGNPARRPRGTSNRATRAAELLLDGEATALTRKAVELAPAGDQAALQLCLDRTVAPMPPTGGRARLAADPQRDRYLGRIKVATDAVRRGAITSSEGSRFPR